MKHIVIPVMLILFGCGLAKVDQARSQAVAENLMNDLMHEDYSKLDSYYTASSNESEPLEKKIEKARANLPREKK